MLVYFSGFLVIQIVDGDVFQLLLNVEVRSQDFARGHVEDQHQQGEHLVDKFVLVVLGDKLELQVLLLRELLEDLFQLVGYVLEAVV